MDEPSVDVKDEISETEKDIDVAMDEENTQTSPNDAPASEIKTEPEESPLDTTQDLSVDTSADIKPIVEPVNKIKIAINTKEELSENSDEKSLTSHILDLDEEAAEMKPRLVGRRLNIRPAEYRGAEKSSLCSIM